MKLKKVGVIHSKYKVPGDAPRQGRRSENLSTIKIYEEYSPGLDDIASYENLIILYWQDRSSRDTLKVIPPGQSRKRGVFSTRSPSRPNPIAICVVDVVKIEGNVLTVKGLDALDNSPLLDIKPYVPELDCINP
ncbi:MAG: tRNA (N6-threonylcarbamoyladenosine(37)-N6)-methyltransferase TrmO [Methanomicrobiales archaeon]